MIKKRKQYSPEFKAKVALEKELQKIIEDKEPDQLKLSFALWTRRAVLQIIKKL